MYTRNRITIVVILLVMLPLIGIVYIDSSLRSRIPANAVGADTVFQTPKDMWYTVDQDQVFPMAVFGGAGGGYRFPAVMVAERVHVAILAIDATNNSVDLTWLSLNRYHVLLDDDIVEVNCTSHVTGSFCESITYLSGETKSEQWTLPGGIETPTTSNVSWVGERHDQYSHLVDLDLQFPYDRDDRGFAWAILLEFSVDCSNASLLDGHEINFMVSYSYYWDNYLFDGPQIGTEWTQDWFPENLTLGNGDTYGQWDCGTIYLVNGDLHYQVLSLES